MFYDMILQNNVLFLFSIHKSALFDAETFCCKFSNEESFYIKLLNKLSEYKKFIYVSSNDTFWFTNLELVFNK